MTLLMFVSVERKDSYNNRPGIICATLESHEQKSHVLKVKGALRKTFQYYDVFIEPVLSLETRKQQRNTRQLLRAIGKEEHFTFKNYF